MEFEVYNPHNKPLSELPFIYGFNNGGSPGFMYAQLLTQDGLGAGSHMCSSEGFMPGDLGCIKGSRSDRHEGFRKTYPDGYQMEFIYSDDIDAHEGFQAALKLAKEKPEVEEIEDAGNTSIKIEVTA